MVKIMENPIKMYDLGVPLFLETPISGMICWIPKKGLTLKLSLLTDISPTCDKQKPNGFGIFLFRLQS